jgi:hypothetical protein
VATNRAKRLKRVFHIQIDSDVRCGGKLAIIASIEEPHGPAPIERESLQETTAPAV